MREVADISADNRAARLNATTVEETAGRARTLAGFVARAEEGGAGAGAEDMAGIEDMAGRLVEMAQMGVGEAEEILSVSRRLEKLLTKSKSALAAIEKAEAEGGPGCFVSLGIPARAARARVAAARDVVAVVEANTAAAVDAEAVAGKTLSAAKEIKSRVAEAAKKMGEEKSGCNCQKKKKEEEEEEMVKAFALEAIKKKMAEFGWL